MKWIKENDRKSSLEDQGEKMAFLWWDKEYEVTKEGRWLLFAAGGYIGEVKGCDFMERKKAEEQALEMLINHNKELIKRYEKGKKCYRQKKSNDTSTA